MMLYKFCLFIFHLNIATPLKSPRGDNDAIQILFVRFLFEYCDTPEVPSRGQLCYTNFVCSCFIWILLHPWSPLEGTMLVNNYYFLSFFINIATPLKSPRGDNSFWGYLLVIFFSVKTFKNDCFVKYFFD